MAPKPTYAELEQRLAELEREIAGYRLARQASAGPEPKYRRILENAREAILVVQDGVVQYANSRAFELLGCRRGEPALEQLKHVCRQHQENPAQPHPAQPAAGEASGSYPLEMVDCSGRTRWVEVYHQTFIWDRKPAGLLFLTDITQRKRSAEKLKHSEQKYRQVINATSQGCLLLDGDLAIVDVNRAALQILGYRRREIAGRRPDMLYDRRTVEFYFASENHLSLEARFFTGFAREVPVLFNRSTLRDEQGRTTGYVCFLTDLTELKLAHEELKKAEWRYRRMYENALQGMYQTTLEGKILRVNPSYAHILGYDTAEELLADGEETSWFYDNPQDREKMMDALRERTAVKDWDLKLKRKDGQSVWIIVNAHLTQNQKGEPIIEGILVDNTARKRAEGKLRRSQAKFRDLALHDNLTGLYNTRYLYKALDNLVAESRATRAPFSLIFMDIDNFKRVVDTYGHLKGSQALREMAATIRDALSEPAYAVAYGGDEFVVVLPGFDKPRALQMAETIRARIRESIYLSSRGHQVSLRASFGVATWPDDAADQAGLLALADQAMFRVKVQGKDGVGLSHTSAS